MWTIGREREKEHARKFLGTADSSILDAVIDAAHDLIEKEMTTDQTITAFRRGFIDGASRTWESTGSWIQKCAKEYPELSDLWLEFASHRSANKRFRAAAFVRELPEAMAMQLLPRLLSDPSAKVRAKVADDQHDSRWAWVVPMLRERKDHETDPKVIASIEFALDSIKSD